jgi:hypothetical protein
MSSIGSDSGGGKVSKKSLRSLERRKEFGEGMLDSFRDERKGN